MKFNRRLFIQGISALSADTLLLTPYEISKPVMNTISNEESPKKPLLLLFDVNETLLDLSSMKARINMLMANESAFSQWFSFMLQYSLVDTVTNHYHDFGTIGQAAFQMTAQKLGKTVSDEERTNFLQMIRRLPPHADVDRGLSMLHKAGYRMVTLTNSTQEVVTQQMESAGLTKYFDAVLSIDPIRKYKPALETYQYATKKMGVRPEETMLIAAHGWDVAGALQAGLQAAFVAREGQVIYPLASKPQLIGENLISIADQL